MFDDGIKYLYIRTSKSFHSHELLNTAKIGYPESAQLGLEVTLYERGIHKYYALPIPAKL